MNKDWIKNATKEKGDLHKALGIPVDKKYLVKDLIKLFILRILQ